METEERRPDAPVVAVLVPVVITMTAKQAAEYAAWYELENPAGELGGAPEAVADLQERDVTSTVLEALMDAQEWLRDLVTVTVLGEEAIPVGEPFKGREEGFVTGVDGHAVAGSEWAAGFRTCEHCHGVTVNG